jgi:hypothetical protein
MMRFAPLASLAVGHDYHGAGAAPVGLIPDVATERLAARPDLRLRLARGRAEVFAAEERAGLAGVAAGGALAFTFRLFPADPRLVAVTAGLAEARDGVAVLDLAEPAVRVVGEGDLRPLVPDGLVTDADARLRPLAVVRIAADPGAENQRYAVRFGAVERFWTYHVIGGAPEAAFRVRDRAGAVGFRALGERVMANGARARSFRSEVPIPASARPATRFELVAEGPFGPRSVVETLPCPRPGPGGLDLEDGATGAVSEIYVNL